MSREISLFADYQQRENAVSNYCGLMMKLIYEESPRKFEELLTTLVPDATGLIVGPSFHQQTKQGKGIPDLSIKQQSFTILFENKLFDWFHSGQINRHVEGFDDSVKIKVLFLLSSEFKNPDNLEQQFKAQIEVAKSQNIILQPITYEYFVDTLENVCKTEFLLRLIEEFKMYLDRYGLLPKWRYLLDVVNCGGTMAEVLDNVYMCPDKGGPYSHRRAKYFGPYANKNVAKIYEIDALVVVSSNLEEAKIKWKNTDDTDEALCERAKEKVKLYRLEENKDNSLQVFLLSDGVDTNFEKDSDGGMQQSKKYFWNIARNHPNSDTLAKELDGKKWSNYKA